MNPSHGAPLPGLTNDQPVGKKTRKLSDGLPVTAVAVTVIGVAFVPVVPIDPVDVTDVLVRSAA